MHHHRAYIRCCESQAAGTIVSLPFLCYTCCWRCSHRTRLFLSLALCTQHSACFFSWWTRRAKLLLCVWRVRRISNEILCGRMSIYRSFLFGTEIRVCDEKNRGNCAKFEVMAEKNVSLVRFRARTFLRLPRKSAMLTENKSRIAASVRLFLSSTSRAESVGAEGRGEGTWAR